MATPVKNISYLTGAVYRLATAFAPRHRIPGIPRMYLAGSVPAPFWLRTQFRDPQILAVGNLKVLQHLRGMGISRVFLLETIFWRKKQNRPARGQLWPLTR